MIACRASHTVTIIFQKINIYKKDTHHNPPPQSSPPSTLSSGRGIGTEEKVCSSRPPHCAMLLSWIFGLKKKKEKGVWLFQRQIFFNKKKTKIPDILRYFKNPPGLIYNDQKGGHVWVKLDYMVGLPKTYRYIVSRQKSAILFTDLQ